MPQQLNRYTPPAVTDYGTLLELTAHVDVNLVGLASNIVMAAMSGPTGGGPGNTPDGTVLTPGPGGGGGTITPDVPTGNGGTATGNEVAGRTATGGGGGSGGGGAGGGGLAGAAVGGGDGKLPFTGYPIMLAAGAGAALTSAGVLLRSKLRRRPKGSG